MAWTVEFIPEAAQQLRKLDRTAAGRIARFETARLLVLVVRVSHRGEAYR